MINTATDNNIETVHRMFDEHGIVLDPEITDRQINAVDHIHSLLSDEGYDPIEIREKIHRILVYRSDGDLPSDNISMDDMVLDALFTEESPRIDPDLWMRDIVDRQSFFSDRIKPILRYSPLWKHHISKDDATRLIKNIVKNDRCNRSSHTLALYFHHVLSLCDDDPGILREISKRIHRTREFLPLLSSVPVSKMPYDLRKSAKKWIPNVDADIEESTKITSVRHVDHYFHACRNLETLFKYSFIGRSSSPSDPIAIYGYHGQGVRMYIDDTLVGFMKMCGEPSILGLQTVRDPNGRLPVVFGGVYGTCNAIIARGRKAYEEQGAWARLDLKHIALFPIRFPWKGDGHIIGLQRFRSHVKKMKKIKEDIL